MDKKVPDHHCDPGGVGSYQSLDLAKVACEPSFCFGVYDERCDGLPIKYESKTAGFQLCPIFAYPKKEMLEESSLGSCVYVLGPQRFCQCFQCSASR